MKASKCLPVNVFPSIHLNPSVSRVICICQYSLGDRQRDVGGRVAKRHAEAGQPHASQRTLSGTFQLTA